MIDKTIDLYESRFGLNIKKSISAAEKVGGLYDNQIINRIASLNFRRYASLNIQMKESFYDLQTFLLGKSFAGQNLFWRERGNSGLLMLQWISLIFFSNMESLVQLFLF